jgi:hypothetical protein
MRIFKLIKRKILNAVAFRVNFLILIENVVNEQTKAKCALGSRRNRIALHLDKDTTNILKCR